MPFIRVGIYKGFINIFQIILDLIICGTDDRLETKSTDQRNTTSLSVGFLWIFGERLIL